MIGLLPGKFLPSEASGFLYKKSGKEELIKATDAVMEGGHYLSEEAARLVVVKIWVAPITCQIFGTY